MTNQGFVSLEAPSEYVFCTYPLHQLSQVFCGLEIADETCLTINASQMLATQHQVMDPSAQMKHNQSINVEPNYVHFIIASINDPSFEDRCEEEEENTTTIDRKKDNDDDTTTIPINHYPNHLQD